MLASAEAGLPQHPLVPSLGQEYCRLAGQCGLSQEPPGVSLTKTTSQSAARAQTHDHFDAAGSLNKNHHDENVGDRAEREAGVQPWCWGALSYDVFTCVLAAVFGASLHLAVQSTLLG